MCEALTIKVYEVVGSDTCVAADDGQEIFNRTSAAMESGRVVSLSFANVRRLTSTFLNTAIGQLYSKFSEQDIREHFRIVDMSSDDIALLRRVVDTAKLYFSDPDRFNATRNEAMGRN